MPKFNRNNIDRKTNKPQPKKTEGLLPDPLLNRANQVRRDDDVIRTPKRTVYDIDFAIKWYIDNEIQPQITDKEEIINVPVIFANGEKWDNVRRLGYLRDEKGKLQSPMIMIKRNSVQERDNKKGLDVNRNLDGNQLIYRKQYNQRNRYEDRLFPIPKYEPAGSQEVYVIDIPRYVTVEYELLIWCDFTSQMNDLVDQIFPYNRNGWGNDQNKYHVSMGSISFETVNTVGEDRLVRATIPLTVLGTLLSGQEARIETIRKMYSIKKVSFDVVVDVGDLNIFNTTHIPQVILQNQQQVYSGGSLVVSGGGSNVSITAAAMIYLTSISEKQATYVSATTVTVSSYAAINPITYTVATVNEFDIYINGQYVDKAVYTWTPTDASTQTITFNTTMLGYGIDPTDVIIIKGRWA
jgi:archaellum component FlaF (FlaF/FlaG flagellin family)